ncbi:MAG: HTTM domain-containing protein, partial [Thermomicrobiales bacterium]
MLRAIQDWFQWAWSEWDRFWFTPVNPSLLGIIRILAGGMIFYTHLVWTKGLEDFFGSQGWQSEALLSKVQERMLCPSFWWYVPDAWLYPVHCVCLAILAAFMLGLASRVTSVLSFAIVVSYAYRAMSANFGLDQVNALLVMYLAIGPCGRCWSLDALIRKWRGGRELPKSVTANISLRLIQLHLCIIYSYAGIAKLGGTFWWNGYAGWLAAANYEYQSGSMLWMANYPYLYNFVTHATIVWELSFWALVWHPRLRPIVLAAGIGMHLGIGAFLGMWTFGLAMIFAYASFIPPEWFDRRITVEPPDSAPPADSTTDVWQSRLQSYIETYIASVTPEADKSPTRVKEPMVVTPRKPETVTTVAASSRLSKKNRQKAEAAAQAASLEQVLVDTDEDAAETASLPRVLLIESRVKNGL